MARIVLSLLVLLTASAIARAQTIADVAEWPKRPVRFIVSSTPGSAGDIVCRVVTQQLGQRLKQYFVIDNRAAAAGIVASETLARSAPDGYTVGLVTTSTHVIATLFNPALAYDPMKDFAPVSTIGDSPYVVAVYPGLPVKNVAELVALAKSKPRQLNNGVFGTTSLGYLAGVLFAELAGVELNSVAYRSSALAALDVAAGRIDMQFSTLAPAIPLIREGRLRALATTGVKRVSLLPEVPTLAEAGLAGYEVSLWMGVAGPAGTAPGIISRLNREISTILNSPEIADVLLQQGMVVDPGVPGHLARRISDDLKKWREVVTRAGIRTRS